MVNPSSSPTTDRDGAELRAVLDAFFHAFLALGCDGAITDWDANAERMFGWLRAEATGMAFRDLVGASERSAYDRGVGWLFQEHERPGTKRIELKGRHKSGHEFPIELSVSAIQSQGRQAFVAFARDLNSRSLAEEKLQESEARQQAVLEQIQDSYFEVDLRGSYVYVNEALARRVGLPASEIVGKNFKELSFIAPDAAATLREVFNTVYRTGQPVKAFEYRTRVRTDGTEAFDEISVSLKRNARGEPVGFHGISRDTTERRRHERELANAKEAAVAATKAKSEFLANMSHEIRTPMNAVIGMTMLVLDTELTSYQRECLETIKSSADSLLTILNDVLDFSKVESRRLELESIPFSLLDTLSKTLKLVAVKADEKGLELVSDIPPDISSGLSARLVGDPVRLQQVLTNLLSNAIKFTERGQVVLMVREEARDDRSVRLHFQVADTGIGVPREKQALIFDAFSQADVSTSRRFGGTGLGLSICSALVRLMGGRIWVESEPGAGSTFHFTASFDIAEPSDATIPRVTPSGFAPSGFARPGFVLPGFAPLDVSVLVVDDNAANRRIFFEQLSRWGMKPTAVENGGDALAAMSAAAAAGRAFRIVLLDANMPGMDGFAVAERIALSPELAGSTIMMLTSSGGSGDAARCRALGISAYLRKPINGVELLQAISSVVEQPRHRPQPPVAKGLHMGGAAAPEMRLRILLAEDNVVNQRVAVGLLQKRGHQVTVVSNGREALERLERDPFDVALMDVQMPELDGFEAVGAWRERERRRQDGGHLKIIALTAHAMSGDRERCLAAGMDGYLTKPLDPNMLFAAIERAGSDAAGGASPASPAPRIDAAAVFQRSHGDERLAHDAIRSFLDEGPRCLASIKSAVDRRDAAGIQAAASVLKKAAANLSAGGLYEAAAILERVGAEQRLDAAEAAWRRVAGEGSVLIDALRSHYTTGS